MISFLSSAISLRVLLVVITSGFWSWDGDSWRKSWKANTLLELLSLCIFSWIVLYSTLYCDYYWTAVSSSIFFRAISFSFWISNSLWANYCWILYSSRSCLLLCASAVSFYTLSSLRSLTLSVSLPLILSRSLSYLVLIYSNSLTLLLIYSISYSYFCMYSCFYLVSRASFLTNSPILALSSGHNSCNLAPFDLLLSATWGRLITLSLEDSLCKF